MRADTRGNVNRDEQNKWHRAPVRLESGGTSFPRKITPLRSHRGKVSRGDCIPGILASTLGVAEPPLLPRLLIRIIINPTPTPGSILIAVPIIECILGHLLMIISLSLFSRRRTRVHILQVWHCRQHKRPRRTSEKA